METSEKLEELGKRVRALDCLYGLSNLVERYRRSLDKIIMGVLDLIPAATCCPETTCVRITLDGKTYQTSGYQPTDQNVETAILVDEAHAGTLTVGRLHQEGPPAGSPFTAEEKELFRALSERLGKIVERHRNRRALEASENRFRSLVENSLAGISIIQGGRVVYQNREQERLLGPLPRSHVLGDFTNIHPADVEKVKRFTRDILAGGETPSDMGFRYAPRGDMERPIWIDCRAHLTEYHGKRAILVNMMDRSQIKELEKLLVRQDKMASLGRVAAGIAHEIRNPLSGINIYLDTLERFYARGESAERVEKIFLHLHSASRKIESVIRRVMDFSKPGEPSLIAADVTAAVQEAINLTKTTLRRDGIDLSTSLAPGLPPCRLDPNQIEEVVLNLINNAVDAIKQHDSRRAIRITADRDGRQVVVRVADSGPGIAVGDREKVFDPFFTTKTDSTGIGLAICQRIVSDHSGSLTVQESRWGGAEFRIALPTDQRPA